MKMKQKLVAGAAVLSALAGLTAPVAYSAEVAATVGASNMYYWRGFDLGGGAAVSADVNVSESGFVAGLWTSSGDAVMGTEYDIYAGYAGSAGDLTYGLSFVSYNYSSPKGVDANDEVWDPVTPGEYIEAVPFIGFGPFKLTYYDAIVAEHGYFYKDYSYVTAELNFEKFALKYGQHALKDGGDGSFDGVSHLDATYKYSTKLSFTVGKIVEDNNFAPEDVNFIVNLSLPIE